MRRITLLLSIAAALVSLVSTGATAALPAPVIYEISPRFEAGALMDIEVTLRFRADASGTTTLQLPQASMGRTQLWRWLRDVRADGATISGDGPVRTLRSRPGRKIAVRYRLATTIDHDPTDADGYPVTPWIRPSWFLVDGPSALAIVADRPDAPMVVKWRGWPGGFEHASSLEPARTADPRHSVLIGGRDLRIVRSGALRLAIRGHFSFTDADLAADLAKILGAERTFFADDAAAPYLVVAVAVPAGSGQSFSGTGKDGAFVMVASTGMTREDLLPLLAHELFHAWNPARLGKPMGPRGYWLSEGFTDFYARRLLQRARLISPTGFASAWNETFRAYGVSPAKTMPGAQAAEAFWTDPDAEKVPYQRGAMLAALWDWRLRQRGLSLDTVVSAQAEAFRSAPDAALTELFIAAMAGKGVDVRGDLARYIDEGAAIDLPEDIFAPCGRLETATASRFELGFEPVPTPDGTLKIARMKPGSAAYRAGLRDGMTILRKVAGTNGDSTQPYELLVRSTDSSATTIRFLPQSDGVVRYQRLALNPAAADNPAICDLR
jgi:predicted metalloprotease with PDZ domain